MTPDTSCDETFTTTVLSRGERMLPPRSPKERQLNTFKDPTPMQNTIGRSAALTLLSLCATLAHGGTAVQPGHTGLWFDPENSGHGLFIHVISPQQAAATWNVFRPDGDQLWLFGDGRVESGRIEFDALRVEGGTFPPQFDESPTLDPFGTFVMTFNGCDSATLSWDFNDPAFATGEIGLTRLSFAAGSTCETRAQGWTWTDLGSPNVLASHGARGHFGEVVGGEVIVGSKDGLWRRPFGNQGAWRRSGLEGVDVYFIERDSSVEGRLFAGGKSSDPQARPFWWSLDGGHTWTNAETGFFEPLEQEFETLVEVVVHPQNPQILFAGFSGGEGLAWSKDGGRNWTRADGAEGAFFGYSCHITFLEAHPDRLYQGCEQPLDVASLFYYPLDLQAQLPLGERVYIAGNLGNEGLPDLSNRRPQRLMGSDSRPGVLYAGLEGAVVAVNRNGELEKIYFSENNDGGADYLYMSAVWVNPRDPSHLLMGGGINGENEVIGIVETFDHGRTLRSLSPPTNVSDPIVDSVLALDDTGSSFLVVVTESEDFRETSRVRVFRIDRS